MTTTNPKSETNAMTTTKSSTEYPLALLSFDLDKKDMMQYAANTLISGKPEDKCIANVVQLAQAAHSMGLNIWAPGEIYGIVRKGKLTIQVGQQSFRKWKLNNPLYAGEDEPEFLYDKNNRLVGARKTIYRWLLLPNGEVCRDENGVPMKQKFIGEAEFAAFCPIYDDKPSVTWQKFPRLMIAKCAEVAATRAAFGDTIGAVYISEEMQQADSGSYPITSKKPEPFVNAKPMNTPAKTDAPTLNEAIDNMEAEFEPNTLPEKEEVVAGPVNKISFVEFMKRAKKERVLRNTDGIISTVKRINSDNVLIDIDGHQVRLTASNYSEWNFEDKINTAKSLKEKAKAEPRRVAQPVEEKEEEKEIEEQPVEGETEKHSCGACGSENIVIAGCKTKYICCDCGEDGEL